MSDVLERGREQQLVDDSTAPRASMTAVTMSPVSVSPAEMLRLDDFFVPDDRVVARTPRADFLANLVFGARLNGTLPIGLARRCAGLLATAGQQEASAAVLSSCARVRDELDAGLADPPALLAARASGAQLAVRAASALVAAGGGASLERSSHHQRLIREAAFTLVAASRPELKRLLVHELTDDERDPGSA